MDAPIGASAQVEHADDLRLPAFAHALLLFLRYRNATSGTPGVGLRRDRRFNRIHAVVGASHHCVVTHPSDLYVALAALDAVVRLSGGSGERTMPLVDFHLDPSSIRTTRA